MIEGKWRLDGSGISGWGRLEGGGEPLWLELVVEGEVLGIARADLPEPEACGFWLPVSDVLLDEGAALSVRVANTNIYLEEDKEGAPENRDGIVGDIVVDRCMAVAGWAIDKADADKKLEIEAWVDGQPLARTVAGERRYRPAIADGHGFSLELPESVADGESHVIELRDTFGRRVPGGKYRIYTFPGSPAAWLRAQKKIDKPLLDLVCGLLDHFEERLPAISSAARYGEWKKAFPVAPPRQRQKAVIEVRGARCCSTGQQGVDLRIDRDRAEYLLFANEGFVPHQYALARMIQEIRSHGAALVYADDETESGEPRFKPAWDREAFFGRDYLGAILVDAKIAASAGITPGDDPETARFKTIMAAEAAGGILHIPELLGQWRESGNAGARERVVSAWLGHNYPGASLSPAGAVYPLREKPRVSIVIPTRDHGSLLKVCLDSLEKTDWPDYEIVIVDNGTVEEDALAVLAKATAKSNVCILRKPGVFNYALLNNEAVRAASGELVCFLNNDIEVLEPQWLTELVRILLFNGAEAGAAGAKLLWPNGLVQHGGVVVGTHQLATHVGNQWLDAEPGYMGRNLIAQQYSAVTAACLLTPRRLFLETGGFDPERFPVAFNDVDYCLRIRSLGKKVLWTPRSRLAHHESASRGRDVTDSARARSEREMSFFRTRWGHYDDPFYNPNLPLSAAGEPFAGLAFPPRPRRPR